MLLERYDGEPPHVAILGAGMLSSSIAQFVSYPLALVRTRLQVRSAQLSSAQLSQHMQGQVLLVVGWQCRLYWTVGVLQPIVAWGGGRGGGPAGTCGLRP
jgi:hypothetical protein